MTATALALVISGCAGWGGGPGGGGPNSINVLMVNNPQMVDLQQLTAKHFTKDTGITVNFTVLPENDVRDKISQEFSSQAGQYDVATLSNFEIPIYAKSKWIVPLDPYVATDPTFDQTYRKDVLAAKGIAMPAKPTWTPSDRYRGEGRPRRAKDGGNLPTRPAGLGSALRPADHRREHLWGDLVHHVRRGNSRSSQLPDEGKDRVCPRTSG